MARAGAKTGNPRSCKVGGELFFSRSVYSDIAARVLRDIRDVKEAAGDVITGFVTGLMGRLLPRSGTHPGIQVDVKSDGEKDETVAFQIDVVARHGTDFYDLALEIQRRVSERVRHMTGRSALVNVNVRGTSL
jgi:uncharacterized alkaline shock family protein YloU